jgi:hypothetical protein
MGLLGLLGCARPAEEPIAPTAARAELSLAHDPLPLILGADERTATGGGLLPTAEAAIARAVHRIESVPDGGLGAGDAAALLRDLDTGAQPVADAGGALYLIAGELARLGAAVQDQDRALLTWGERAGRILGTIRRQWLAARDRARQLAGLSLADHDRVTLSLALAGQLRRLLAGPVQADAESVDSASLLELRDALGYVAAGDGIDWNCRAEPAALLADLQSYRETELFCGQRLAPYDAVHDDAGA